MWGRKRQCKSEGRVVVLRVTKVQHAINVLEIGKRRHLQRSPFQALLNHSHKIICT